MNSIRKDWFTGALPELADANCEPDWPDALDTELDLPDPSAAAAGDPAELLLADGSLAASWRIWTLAPGRPILLTAHRQGFHHISPIFQFN